ncbi:hypothetical protein [Nocardia sp. CA-135398]|uniref:hypothetical protein n=1 Tax=Nocardia sp. CA-135398 TaxID=3239977 RepID=UPI003D992F0F
MTALVEFALEPFDRRWNTTASLFGLISNLAVGSPGCVSVCSSTNRRVGVPACHSAISFMHRGYD